MESRSRLDAAKRSSNDIKGFIIGHDYVNGLQKFDNENNHD